PRPGLLLRAPAARCDRARAGAPPLPLAPARPRRLTATSLIRSVSWFQESPQPLLMRKWRVRRAASVRRSPDAEHAPRVDAGLVTVVPADLDAPRADELGALGAQWHRRARRRPRLEPLLAPAATSRARTVDAQLLEAERVGVAVGPGERQALGAIELDL